MFLGNTIPNAGGHRTREPLVMSQTSICSSCSIKNPSLVYSKRIYHWKNRLSFFHWAYNANGSSWVPKYFCEWFAPEAQTPPRPSACWAPHGRPPVARVGRNSLGSKIALGDGFGESFVGIWWGPWVTCGESSHRREMAETHICYFAFMCWRKTITTGNRFSFFQGGRSKSEFGAHLGLSLVEGTLVVGRLTFVG